MTLRTYVAIYFLLVFQDHHGANRRVDYYKICSLVITTYLLSCVLTALYIIYYLLAQIYLLERTIKFITYCISHYKIMG